MNTAKWKRKYKDVIWVVNSDYYDNFGPPLGVKAELSFKESVLPTYKIGKTI